MYLYVCVYTQDGVNWANRKAAFQQHKPLISSPEGFTAIHGNTSGKVLEIFETKVAKMIKCLSEYRH